MYVFSYWYAYYDSLFLKPKIKPSRFFLQQLQISSAVNIKWNSFKELPQLGSMFETLERFIMENAAYKDAFCNQNELTKIEEKMNNLVVLLHCQKIYAKQYWENDKRRVQAGFVHLFIIFKQYLLAIIPKDCLNILQASNQNRLPTNIVQLELVNSILKLIKQIHNYLFLPFFQEEKQLTHQLLLNFSQFLQKLPHINITQITEIPKLMKFVCICNTFQVQSNSINQFKQIRNKSESFQPKIKLQSHLVNKFVEEESKSDILMNNEFLKKSYSLSKNNSNNKPQQDEKSMENTFSFFKFNQKLRKNSLATSRKHNENIIYPLSDSFLSVNKKSRQRSATIKLKFNTLIKSRTFQQKSSPMPRLTVRKQPSIKIQEKIKELNQEQQEQIQRAKKVKKTKKNQLTVKYSKLSQNLVIETGKAKGWALIRQYINNRIVLRKLKNLINYDSFF